jgi:hypothetical protein
MHGPLGVKLPSPGFVLFVCLSSTIIYQQHHKQIPITNRIENIAMEYMSSDAGEAVWSVWAAGAVGAVGATVDDIVEHKDINSDNMITLERIPHRNGSTRNITASQLYLYI